MKKLGALLLLTVFLTGCSDGSKEIERGMELRSRLLQAQSVSFDADITADYGESLQKFSVQCQADGKGDLHFTVTAPDSISGITGTITEEGGKLTFDDTALHFELLTDEQLSPVSAPWIFLKTLRSGYLRAAGMEEDQLRLTIDDSYDDDALTLDIWLREGDIPERAEVLYDGRRILSLDVKNVHIT